MECGADGSEVSQIQINRGWFAYSYDPFMDEKESDCIKRCYEETGVPQTNYRCIYKHTAKLHLPFVSLLSEKSCIAGGAAIYAYSRVLQQCNPRFCSNKELPRYDDVDIMIQCTKGREPEEGKDYEADPEWKDWTGDWELSENESIDIPPESLDYEADPEWKDSTGDLELSENESIDIPPESLGQKCTCGCLEELTRLAKEIKRRYPHAVFAVNSRRSNIVEVQLGPPDCVEPVVLQLVLVLYQDVYDLLDSFDLDASRVAITSNNVICAANMATWDLWNMRISKPPTDALLKRLVKYSCKGFACDTTAISLTSDVEKLLNSKEYSHASPFPPNAIEFVADSSCVQQNTPGTRTVSSDFNRVLEFANTAIGSEYITAHRCTRTLVAASADWLVYSHTKRNSLPAGHTVLEHQLCTAQVEIEMLALTRHITPYLALVSPASKKCIDVINRIAKAFDLAECEKPFVPRTWDMLCEMFSQRLQENEAPSNDVFKPGSPFPRRSQKTTLGKLQVAFKHKSVWMRHKLGYSLGVFGSTKRDPAESKHSDHWFKFIQTPQSYFKCVYGNYGQTSCTTRGATIVKPKPNIRCAFCDAMCHLHTSLCSIEQGEELALKKLSLLPSGRSGQNNMPETAKCSKIAASPAAVEWVTFVLKVLLSLCGENEILRPVLNQALDLLNDSFPHAFVLNTTELCTVVQNACATNEHLCSSAALGLLSHEDPGFSVQTGIYHINDIEDSIFERVCARKRTRSVSKKRRLLKHAQPPLHRSKSEVSILASQENVDPCFSGSPLCADRSGDVLLRNLLPVRGVVNIVYDYFQGSFVDNTVQDCERSPEWLEPNVAKLTNIVKFGMESFRTIREHEDARRRFLFSSHSCPYVAGHREQSLLQKCVVSANKNALKLWKKRTNVSFLDANTQTGNSSTNSDARREYLEIKNMLVSTVSDGFWFEWLSSTHTLAKLGYNV